MIIGFTGHQNIHHPERWGWVQEQFVRVLREVASPGDRVASSLAKGGDQLISEVALAEGIAIEVVVPSAGYEATFAEPAALARYTALMGQAVSVTKLEFPIPSEDAFLAAGRQIVGRSGVVVALWNGKAASGRGGTGDIVAYARDLGRLVIHVNPDSMQVVRLESIAEK